MGEFPRKLSIEGNIGAGKTSLAKRIAKDFGHQIVHEEFEDNPFLPLFFENHSEYAFQMESKFLVDRVNHLIQWDEPEYWVSDYAFFKSEVYASNNLSELEMQLFHEMHQIMMQRVPQAECIVYLTVSAEQAKENILKRGREFELDTPIEYLKSIDKTYREYLKNSVKIPVIFIDCSGKDFVNQKEDYLAIIGEIQEKWDKKKR